MQDAREDENVPSNYARQNRYYTTHNSSEMCTFNKYYNHSVTASEVSTTGSIGLGITGLRSITRVGSNRWHIILKEALEFQNLHIIGDE